MKLLKIIFWVILFFPSSVLAQLNYSIHVQYGYSNLIENNREASLEVGNKYSKLPSYSLGLSLNLPVSTSNYLVSSGVDIISLASKYSLPDDFFDPNYTGPYSWEERYYSLNVPFKLIYKFEGWLLLNVGLSNTIHLKTPETATSKKINYYSLGLSGGFDFLIYKRFLIGCNYSREIIPTAKLLKLPSQTETYDISYSFEHYALKIGYMF